MLQALLKLIVLTLAFLILSVFAVFFVRWMGFQQSFAPPSHPWFQQTFWSIYAPPTDVVCAGSSLGSKVPSKEWIVSLPVKRVDGRWVIPCEKPVPLTDFLKNEPHPNLLLHISATDTWDLEKLVENVSPFERTKNFGVMAESQKVSLFLRKKAPQWLYAADSSNLARMQLFESLWIETAMDFWPDFVISPPTPQSQLKIDERLAAEFARRQKRIVWNQEYASEEPRIPYQGIMTPRSSK